MNAADIKIIRDLMEGCEAALSALEDGTRSNRRIQKNIEYLSWALTAAKDHIEKQTGKEVNLPDN